MPSLKLKPRVSEQFTSEEETQTNSQGVGAGRTLKEPVVFSTYHTLLYFIT